MNHPTMFIKRENKTKLVLASFSYNFEFLWKKSLAYKVAMSLITVIITLHTA